MSLLENFSKKDVTAYPSGRDVATGKESEAKFWTKAIAFSLVVGIGMSSVMETGVKAMNNARERNRKATEYDSSLLATIDSVAATGIPMENAVEKGFTITNHRLGTDSLLTEHIDRRLAEARDIADIKTNDAGDYDTVFAYKPAFRESLAHVVQKRQNCNKSNHGNDDGAWINSTVGRSVMSSFYR